MFHRQKFHQTITNNFHQLSLLKYSKLLRTISAPSWKQLRPLDINLKIKIFYNFQALSYVCINVHITNTSVVF